MFNWFRPKKQYDTDDDKLASITYYVKSDNTIKLDIAMQDYDDDSINAITSLFEVLSKESFFVETINFFQKSMLENERDDIVARVFINLGNFIRINKEKQDEKDQSPYIKPSELSKG